MKNYWFICLALVTVMIHITANVLLVPLPWFELMSFYILVTFGIRYFIIFLWFGLAIDMSFQRVLPLTFLLAWGSFIPKLCLVFFNRKRWLGLYALVSILCLFISCLACLLGVLVTRSWPEHWLGALIGMLGLMIFFPIIIRFLDYIGVKLLCPIFSEVQERE